jgi:pyruvoyl-dependent arginine decarboxylase (PvlArgDC)
MTDLNLTDADVSAIENRLVQAKFAAAIPRMPPPTGWAKEAHETQEAKRLQRIAAAQAEEERLRRRREAAAERRRVEREENAPIRKAALEHAALLRPKLAEAQARLDAIEAEFDAAERAGT